MNKKSICLLVAGLLLLPGCIRVPTYHQRSLELLRNNFGYRYTTEDGITVCAKRLNHPEKNYMFNGRAAALDFAEVIYFSIHNLSFDDYTISPEDIGLVQITHHDIQKTIKKTSTSVRFLGAAVTGGLGVNSVIVASQLMHVHALEVLYLTVLPIAILYISDSIIFLAHGIKSAVMNNRISRDLKEKILHETVTIASGDRYECLIFVKSSDYIPYFTMMLNEKDRNNRITFAVELQ